MFKPYKDNPIISRTNNTFYSKHVANPDILLFKNKLFLYFRGQGETCHDQIGVFYTSKETFDGVTWLQYENNPIIKISSKEDAFDNRHILDPATVVMDNKVYLYYSGHSYHQKAGIGLAISEDGFSFNKYSNKPIIENAIAPEVVIKDNIVYLFYQKKVKKDVFSFFCCTSTDGLTFNISDEFLVFTPSNIKETFDSYSISTMRILKENDTYYMTYGGCEKFADYPIAFGLAKSSDLINWKRYENNPIYKRGKASTWDEGAIWFGTLYKHKNTYYMWYEGTGVGNPLITNKALSDSKLCRNTDYGGYATSSFSQIGLATYNGKLF